MFAAGVGNSTTEIGPPNATLVKVTDPNSPVVRPKQEMDDEANFMRLMIEQLKNQDPMSPMDSKDFTAQLSQINSLQQLIGMNKSMEQIASGGKLSEATALLGRYVEGLDANGDAITGAVERVEMLGGEPVLKIGDKLLLPGQVIAVDDAEMAAGEDA